MDDVQPLCHGHNISATSKESFPTKFFIPLLENYAGHANWKKNPKPTGG